MTRAIRFGTDGVRARAGDWPLTADGVRRIGHAVAAMAKGSPARVIVGRDTRASGTWLEDALVEGLVAGGAVALRGGVMPTAAVSCAVASSDATAGVVLTASHNPAHDNGVKVLGPDGGKLSDDAQQALEAAFNGAPHRTGGEDVALDDACSSWRSWMPTVDLRGVRVLLDCASGAAAYEAPELLSALGATVVRRDADPDGDNINAGVGATHPPTAEDTAAAGCDLAICLDGDADRIMLVDPQRGLLDGDDLLWLLGGSGPVVGTIMSNGGLEEALQGRLVRTPVGDRHVAAGMRTHNAGVGAEPSGHVLFSDGMPTGDGLYAALRALAATAGPTGRPTLPLPVDGWQRWPQILRNVRLTGPKRPLESLATPAAAEAAGCRVVVRYSGTEPLVRIMVEAPPDGPADPNEWVDRIAMEFST